MKTLVNLLLSIDRDLENKYAAAKYKDELSAKNKKAFAWKMCIATGIKSHETGLTLQVGPQATKSSQKFKG